MAHWKYFAIGAGILLIVTIFWASCGKPKPVLNEQEIQRGEQAVKERNDKELKQILVEAEQRQKVADGLDTSSKAKVVEAYQESHRKYDAMTIEQLQAEFEKGKQ